MTEEEGKDLKAMCNLSQRLVIKTENEVNIRVQQTC